ncbi:adenosine deaminase [Enterovibrio norvegicus]|uniref:Adenine deaminase n=1 Tax=Enterovibrio norvegicus TaxID=188144 RepID=A0ABV4L181_9GAMM|nr:adenosine deaminase [Enterovibrio norvegicus]MCC4796786.1 adenosine deaminase [Enterovibrio norvegicus]OEF60229.1 adenosine deaminase [Enterovibrio norvegicus]PMH63186.1 adenosine deaminase [Enterovibrio norvegicus]PMI27671.1 adenosine deaminase [Enterovibrio norvegicus]PMI35096.1 adenosine deaminase [Enterovibrio norvegicus]
MEDFIRHLPKVELHLHIEGSLEPELMFKLAERNGISLPYANVEEARAAYHFHNLQSFLDIYYQGANVLITERDFFDLTWAYLMRCKADNVMHTEIFFDPQTHTERGIAFDTAINGIYHALRQGEKELGITSKLIMCFLRHLSEDAAFETLEQAKPHLHRLVGVGLDSSEVGHPPEKFARVFAEARALGLKAVAHAGEEGPASNIWDAMRLLHVNRIDHGVQCVQDPELVQELARTRMPLTVCPLSNTKLCVFDKMEDHNILSLLDEGLCVTVNSDDPAFFGGYMNDNFLALNTALSPSKEQLTQLSRNAIEAAFLNEDERKLLIQNLDDFWAKHGIH